MGDPGGVGPEVILKALDDGAVRRRARWLLFASDRAMTQAARECRIPAAWTELPGQFASTTLTSLEAGEVGVVDLCRDVGLDPATDFARRPDRTNGVVSFECVRRAIELMQLPGEHPWRAGAVVTGPISKEAWALAGWARYPGHTELFAESFRAQKFAMMFHAPPAQTAHGQGPGLNVILATVHRPLRTVPGALTTARVLETIELGHGAMRRLGFPSPRIGVCGLNPHAGEHGLLGDEDDRVISPAVAAARNSGWDASGPWPADTIFQGALAYEGAPAARFDLVVAMYHDQGLIPLKTLAWDRAVNFTVGLSHGGHPVWRTSPDHGTAFDIAGAANADAGSMKAAVLLAVRLAGSDGESAPGGV